MATWAASAILVGEIQLNSLVGAVRIPNQDRETLLDHGVDTCIELGAEARQLVAVVARTMGYAGSLWPDEPYWRTKGPSISDRCVVVEGTYSGGAGGHFGMFNGTILDVLRLDVWSTPHRPFVTTPPPPRPSPTRAR